jgi:hypothetical protein
VSRRRPCPVLVVSQNLSLEAFATKVPSKGDRAGDRHKHWGGLTVPSISESSPKLIFLPTRRPLLRLLPRSTLPRLSARRFCGVAEPDKASAMISLTRVFIVLRRVGVAVFGVPLPGVRRLMGVRFFPGVDIDLAGEKVTLSRRANTCRSRWK